MAEFANTAPCPLFVARLVQARLAEAVRRRDNPHWLRRLLGIVCLGPYEECADVRWFSEWDVNTKACSGYLLGRWLVTPERVVPLGWDELLGASNIRSGELYSLLHAVLFDFALTGDETRCMLVVTDLKGRIQCAEYELSNGAQSDALGPMVGVLIKRRVPRAIGDPCIPKGWRPRPS